MLSRSVVWFSLGRLLSHQPLYCIAYQPTLSHKPWRVLTTSSFIQQQLLMLQHKQTVKHFLKFKTRNKVLTTSSHNKAQNNTTLLNLVYARDEWLWLCLPYSFLPYTVWLWIPLIELQRIGKDFFYERESNTCGL